MLEENFLHKLYPLRGDFIVFEGYNGVGKTSLAKALVKEMKNKYIPTLYTHEPTEAVNEIRNKAIALNDGNCSSEDIEINTYLLDRFAHLSNTICPLIGKGVKVVCDRYDWSTLVYQNIDTRERQTLYTDVMNMIGRNTWIQPDLYIYCYADAKLIQKRLLTRDNIDVDINKIKIYCDRYNNIADFFCRTQPERIVVFKVDGKMKLDDQVKELYSAVSDKLNWEETEKGVGEIQTPDQ